MTPAAPTGEDLYARLRSMYPGLAEEDIARELGTTTRDVQRLKSLGPTGQKLVGLLWAAGWLNPGAKLSAREQERRAAIYRELRQSQRRSRSGK